MLAGAVKRLLDRAAEGAATATPPKRAGEPISERELEMFERLAAIFGVRRGSPPGA